MEIKVKKYLSKQVYKRTNVQTHLKPLSAIKCFVHFMYVCTLSLSNHYQNVCEPFLFWVESCCEKALYKETYLNKSPMVIGWY